MSPSQIKSCASPVAMQRGGSSRFPGDSTSGPTPDLVKQAVFNCLGARVIGARVLELFAGTGALSLECLSRGAVSALCLEKSHRHAEFIRANARAANFEAALEIRRRMCFRPSINWRKAAGSSI